MPCFSVFYALLCSRLMIRVTCSHVYLMSLATILPRSMCLCTFFHVSCLDLHPYIYVLGFMFYHVYVLNFYMFTCMFLCLYAYIYISMPICLCSLHALYFFPCDCVLYAMFVCLGLDLVCHVLCYCSPFVASSFFLVFWPNS